MLTPAWICYTLLVLACALRLAVAVTDAGDTAALRQLYASTGRGEGNCLYNSQWGNTSSDPCDDGWSGLQLLNESFGCSGQQGDSGRRVLGILLAECSMFPRGT